MDIGYLLEVDYKGREVYLYGTKGMAKIEFLPYFLVRGVEREKLESIKFSHRGKIIRPVKIEKVKKILKFPRGEEFFKVYFEDHACLKPAKDYLKEHFPNIEIREWDIPFRKRVQVDLQLEPFQRIVVKDNSIAKKFSEEVHLSWMCFDIEVYNPKGVPDPKKDPVILISYATEDEEGILALKNSKAKKPTDIKIVEFSTERELLLGFQTLVKEMDPDILIGYNSAVFDLPYLVERAKRLKISFDLSRYGRMRKVSKGLNKGYDIAGRVHLDLYPVVRLMATLGVIDVFSHTLYDAYFAVSGEEKLMVEKPNIWEFWDKGDEKLYRYSLEDALATKVVAKAFLPLEIELSKVAKSFLFDTSLSTSGQLVESLLLFEAQNRNLLIPRRPTEEEVTARLMNPIKGAFVKMPEPGIYSNIAVLDFRSLYPSIIITYNVDYYTYVKCSSETNRSPLGWCFLKKPGGLMPALLDEIIDKRDELKEKLRHAKNEKEKERLAARRQALKILANSFYGYMGYARSRFYLREAAESVTAWGRKHIKETIAEAEKFGFTVLYADTDSVFLLMNGKTKEDVLKFMSYINQRLPGKMRLDLEDFYIRGVFVSKKTEKEGAKKKYALLSESGKIKIRGFELVRRDWSQIARETQKRVLEIILREGSKEKAVEYVKSVINDIRKGKIPVEKMVIWAQLQKDLEEYEVISPEVMAAKRLKAMMKKPVTKGTLVAFVITKQGRSISEKAYPAELAKDYDAEYYINNQILPAVMKILKELGIEEKELIVKEKQKGLWEFM